jgi:hypothetical protein
MFLRNEFSLVFVAPRIVTTKMRTQHSVTVRTMARKHIFHFNARYLDLITSVVLYQISADASRGGENVKKISFN